MFRHLRLLWKTIWSWGAIALVLWAGVVLEFWWVNVGEGLTAEKVIRMSPTHWAVVIALTAFTAAFIGSYRIVSRYDLEAERKRQAKARKAFENLLGIRMEKGRALLMELQAKGASSITLSESKWNERYREWDSANKGLIEFAMGKGRAEAYALAETTGYQSNTLTEAMVMGKMGSLKQLIRDHPGITLTDEFIKKYAS